MLLMFAVSMASWKIPLVSRTLAHSLKAPVLAKSGQVALAKVRHPAGEEKAAEGAILHPDIKIRISRV